MTPWTAPAITTTTASESMANAILADVGATKPSRDAVDTRVLADFAAGTGAFVDTLTYPDDWPTYSTPSAPTDTDGDGIPDTYEAAHPTHTIEDYLDALCQ